MPTPFELLADPASLTVFALYAALLLWEALAPARALPLVRGWRARTFVAFAAYFLVSSYLPLWWGEWLAPLRLVDLTHLGRVEGAMLAFALYQAGAYAWHRSMHAFDPLWRAFHQMHHSAERLDAWSAFWFSPLDMIGWTALMSLTLAIVGFSPEAAMLTLYASTFTAIFQHSNIRTPRWLGYIVQRPESHSHHHARGVHADNYADLPVFDLVFGTFRNPRTFAPETGFYDGASRRVGDMLRCRDVSGAAEQARTGRAVLAPTAQGDG
jgi:sterol desaturase/sphingolipid hydroxylase (fatty acid hydroxylase superfamily)